MLQGAPPPDDGQLDRPTKERAAAAPTVASSTPAKRKKVLIEEPGTTLSILQSLKEEELAVELLDGGQKSVPEREMTIAIFENFGRLPMSETSSVRGKVRTVGEITSDVGDRVIGCWKTFLMWCNVGFALFNFGIITFFFFQIIFVKEDDSGMTVKEKLVSGTILELSYKTAHFWSIVVATTEFVGILTRVLYVVANCIVFYVGKCDKPDEDEAVRCGKFLRSLGNTIRFVRSFSGMSLFKYLKADRLYRDSYRNTIKMEAVLVVRAENMETGDIVDPCIGCFKSHLCCKCLYKPENQRLNGRKFNIGWEQVRCCWWLMFSPIFAFRVVIGLLGLCTFFLKFRMCTFIYQQDIAEWDLVKYFLLLKLGNQIHGLCDSDDIQRQAVEHFASAGGGACAEYDKAAQLHKSGVMSRIVYAIYLKKGAWKTIMWYTVWGVEELTSFLLAASRIQKARDQAKRISQVSEHDSAEFLDLTELRAQLTKSTSSTGHSREQYSVRSDTSSKANRLDALQRETTGTSIEVAPARTTNNARVSSDSKSGEAGMQQLTVRVLPEDTAAADVAGETDVCSAQLESREAGPRAPDRSTATEGVVSDIPVDTQEEYPGEYPRSTASAVHDTTTDL